MRASPPPNSDYESVVAALTPWLEATARKKLRPIGLRDLEDAAHDIVQLTWVKVWCNWEHVEHGDPRRRDNYIYTTLLNNVRDLGRARRRQLRSAGVPVALGEEATAPDGESYLLELADPSASVSQVVSRADLSLLLRRFRVRLAARGARRWQLHYVRLLAAGETPQTATRLVRPEMSGARYRGQLLQIKTAYAKTNRLRHELAQFLSERTKREE